MEERESTDFVHSGVVEVKKEYEGCLNCSELQDKIAKANDRCAHLELGVVEKNLVIESLKGKLSVMELKVLKLEDEVSVLKQRNEELEKSTRSDDDEDNKITQLMVENKALECEKNAAESQVGVLKLKCKEFEIKVMELEKRLWARVTKTGLDFPELYSAETSRIGGPPAVGIGNENKGNEDMDVSGTPPTNTPLKHYMDAEGFKGGQKCDLKSGVRKFLDYAVGGSACESISPSTPGGRPPCVPINISDSDDDLNDASMPKRSRVSREVAYIVTSESESDCDDNIPIGRLSSKHLPAHNSDNRRACTDSCSKGNDNKPTPRRRLVRVGNLEGKGVAGESRTETMNDTVGKDEMEDDDSSSEGESLGGFIVSSSDVSEKGATASDCDDLSDNRGTSSGDGSGDSERLSESSVAYDEVISSLRRERKDKTKWECEADMLADFGKHPELCMKAVCVLFLEQTSEEQSCKATIDRNGRGFNQLHALMGSKLANFLTDGDPYSDIKKSVEELQAHDSKGVEKCHRLATHYSKQLFRIYESGVVPFFHP